MTETIETTGSDGKPIRLAYQVVGPVEVQLAPGVDLDVFDKALRTALSLDPQHPIIYR